MEMMKIKITKFRLLPFLSTSMLEPFLHGFYRLHNPLITKGEAGGLTGGKEMATLACKQDNDDIWSCPFMMYPSGWLASICKRPRQGGLGVPPCMDNAIYMPLSS